MVERKAARVGEISTATLLASKQWYERALAGMPEELMTEMGDHLAFLIDDDLSVEEQLKRLNKSPPEMQLAAAKAGFIYVQLVGFAIALQNRAVDQ